MVRIIQRMRFLGLIHQQCVHAWFQMGWKQFFFFFFFAPFRGYQGPRNIYTGSITFDWGPFKSSSEKVSSCPNH